LNHFYYNSANLRSTLINQVQGAGVTTLQQKKNWLIDWYFSNDPMGSIYLATLRNLAFVSTYQTNPGMLYGAPFATGMENYFQRIKNYFGQSMFDQLVTEFAQQSNLYVDEIKVDEFHLYGSNRLGVYEANKPISRRVARDLNNDNQVSNNEYIVETPEEVLYLYSSYQLERGAKRYELANHLGNVLTVISDKKTANFTGSTFSHFTAERISATDYSPFGAPLAGRTWNGGEYRFGFNSMEKDNEINGAGNAYDFGARIYDARLGRWLSVDPNENNYPGINTYNFSFNMPLLCKDPDGKDGRVSIKGNVLIIETTVHLYGPNASQFYKLNKGFEASGKVEINGKIYIVKITAKYVLNKKLDELTKGKNTSFSSLAPQANDYLGQGDTEKIEDGDNIMYVDNSFIFPGDGVGGMTDPGGSGARLKFFDAQFNEVLNMIGFGDRYSRKRGALFPDRGFGDDYLSNIHSMEMKFHPVHIFDAAIFIMKKIKDCFYRSEMIDDVGSGYEENHKEEKNEDLLMKNEKVSDVKFKKL